MQTPPELNLLTHFQDLPDPRTKREPAHKLIDILVIAVCTLLCGGEGFNDMEDFGQAKHDWLKTFLELPSRVIALSATFWKISSAACASRTTTHAAAETRVRHFIRHCKMSGSESIV